MSTTKDKTYSEDQIPSKLSEYGLDKWYYEDKWIRRKFNTDGWPTTLMAVNAVGYLCEAAGHHADLNVTWGKLWVKLATHSAGMAFGQAAIWRRVQSACPSRRPAWVTSGRFMRR